ncbi:MAG: hypothetical protein FJY67_01180 [Calditrichaeota bacterium]|nr:hypothetical protein [Calditrichota bacterium]
MKNQDRRTRADIEPILREVVEILVRDYQPELIILYGSYAWGNPTRHSDIDLFIVKKTDKDRIDRYVEAAGLIFKPDRHIALQPNIYTPSELAARMRIGDYFVEEVLTKGKVLIAVQRLLIRLCRNPPLPGVWLRIDAAPCGEMPFAGRNRGAAPRALALLLLRIRLLRPAGDGQNRRRAAAAARRTEDKATGAGICVRRASFSRSAATSPFCCERPQKTHKLWVWKAYFRDSGRLIDWECGGRDQSTFQRLMNRPKRWKTEVYCTDNWNAYALEIEPEKHCITNLETTAIERDNGRQRHWLGRFRRRSVIISRSAEMADLSIALFAHHRINGDMQGLPLLG